jgi:hypothetical protein
MLFSGLPPLVREGDEFSAMFTLRNTTDKSLPGRIRVEDAGADRQGNDDARGRGSQGHQRAGAGADRGSEAELGNRRDRG